MIKLTNTMISSTNIIDGFSLNTIPFYTGKKHVNVTEVVDQATSTCPIDDHKTFAVEVRSRILASLGIN